MVNQLTKKFIEKQKKHLEQDLEKVKKQIEELKKADPFADPEHVSDNAAVDTDVREQVGHETIEAQLKDLEKRVLDIKAALAKIEKNNYGVCGRCGKPIPIARLKLIPEATFCVECENKLRK